MIGNRGGIPYGLRYRLVCGEDWVTRSLDITTTDGRASMLSAPTARASGPTARGWPVAHLDGCIDIDLAGSPFTNTLPIRRAGLVAGARRPNSAWPTSPSTRSSRWLTGRSTAASSRTGVYRYEAADRSFTADLTVDEDGLVTDYPGLFTRVIQGNPSLLDR